MGAGRKIRMGALAAAGGVFALAGGAALLLIRLDRTRAGDRMASDAQAAGLLAADGVRTLVGSLEVQVQNGTANPRLVAALDANVDQETLRDLLLTEPWWEPFRRAVDGYGLYSDETTAVVTSRLPVNFDAHAMVHDAREAHHPSSGLMEAAGQVMAVASSPVALTGRSDWPVLVATKVLDVGLLSGMAEQAGASVAISDGRRLLVAATTGASGGADELTALKQAIALSAPGVGSAGGATVAVLPLSNGLRILVGVAPPASEPSGMPLPPTVLAILGLGLVFGIAIFVLLTRRTPEEPPVEKEGPAVAALTVIGRYTLVDRIGQGGMAEIYSAVTTGEGSFRRPVVIKRLRPEMAVDPNAVAQFCDEANLLSAFHHPNIVAVHDFGRWQNQFFLAEEYVPGRDLGALVARRFNRDALPLPPEFVAYVAYEILKALDYAHTLQSDQGRPLGIVHRDISPENVMVSLRGDVKLLDFGVGKAAEGRVAKTEMGVVKGNVTYMSPEQARGLEVDSRADLYSLGLVMFGCCAGQPLYTGDTTYALLMKAGVGPGPDDRAAIDRLPRPFGAVVQRATAARIEDRYASAREMASDLEPWARQGAAVAGAIVTELYGPELRDEAHRLATFVVDAPTATAANLSLR